MKDVKIAWEVPEIWFDMELYEDDIKNLKNINSDYKRFLVLLYRGLNYQDHSIWSQEPPIKNHKEYMDSFYKILKKKDLLLPFSSHKDRYIEAILVHVFIPKTYAEAFLNAVYSLYKKLDSNPEVIDNLSKEELSENLKNVGSHFVKCILSQKILIPKLLSVIREIFEIWNEESDTYSFPDWFAKLVFGFKERKEEIKRKRRKCLIREDDGITLCPSFKKSNREFAFFDAESKRIKPHIDHEKKEIVLSRQLYYVVIREDVDRQSTLKDNFNFFKYQDDNYFIYEVGGYPLDNEKIKDYSIYTYRENISEYVNLVGESIPYLFPEDEATIFYDSFSLNVSRKEFFSFLSLITPDGVYDLKDLLKKNKFDKEGRYILRYGIRRSLESLSEEEEITVYQGEKVFYVLKNRPALLRNLKIRYKGKVYDVGDVVEEPFGVFKVKISSINLEESIFDKNQLKIKINNPIKGLKIRIYNRCDFYVSSFDLSGDNFSVDLSPYSDYFLYPVKVCIFLNGRFPDCAFFGKKDKKLCPFLKFKEVVLNSVVSGSYKHALPEFKLREDLPVKIKISGNLLFFLKKTLGIKDFIETKELLKKLEVFLNSGLYLEKKQASIKLVHNEEFGKILNRFFMWR